MASRNEYHANGEHWEDRAIRRQTEEHESVRNSCGLAVPRYPAWLQAELEAMDAETPESRRAWIKQEVDYIETRIANRRPLPFPTKD